MTDYELEKSNIKQSCRELIDEIKYQVWTFQDVNKLDMDGRAYHENVLRSIQRFLDEKLEEYK